jgi:hypothetical protein
MLKTNKVPFIDGEVNQHLQTFLKKEKKYSLSKLTYLEENLSTIINYIDELFIFNYRLIFFVITNLKYIITFNLWKSISWRM